MSALQRLAGGELDGWTGLPGGLVLADVGAVMPLGHGASGNGVLGDEHRDAQWVAAASERYQGGVRVWHDGGAVLVIEARDPTEAGRLPTAPDLGEPEATLDTTLGMLVLEGGELVYASRGLSLRVNPANRILLGVLAFAPTSAADYGARLRPDLPPPTPLPDWSAA
jgi:hypothetical protein